MGEGDHAREQRRFQLGDRSLSEVQRGNLGQRRRQPSVCAWCQSCEGEWCRQSGEMEAAEEASEANPPSTFPPAIWAHRTQNSGVMRP